MNSGRLEERTKIAFGASVRLHRKQNGLTQAELAAKSGLHRTYIADIERGARNLSLSNIVRIAGALPVPVSELCAPLDTVTPTGEL